MTDDARIVPAHPGASVTSCILRTNGISLRPDEDPFAMPPWMPRLGRKRETAADAELRSALLGLAAYSVMLAVLGVLAGSLVLG